MPRCAFESSHASYQCQPAILIQPSGQYKSGHRSSTQTVQLHSSRTPNVSYINIWQTGRGRRPGYAVLFAQGSTPVCPHWRCESFILPLLVGTSLIEGFVKELLAMELCIIPSQSQPFANIAKYRPESELLVTMRTNADTEMNGKADRSKNQEIAIFNLKIRPYLHEHRSIFIRQLNRHWLYIFIAPQQGVVWIGIMLSSFSDYQDLTACPKVDSSRKCFENWYHHPWIG